MHLLKISNRISLEQKLLPDAPRNGRFGLDGSIWFNDHAHTNVRSTNYIIAPSIAWILSHHESHDGTPSQWSVEWSHTWQLVLSFKLIVSLFLPFTPCCLWYSGNTSSDGGRCSRSQSPPRYRHRPQRTRSVCRAIQTTKDKIR
jgi:hypothetical protein